LCRYICCHDAHSPPNSIGENSKRSPLGRWRLGKQSRRCNDNIKMDLRGKGWGKNVDGTVSECYSKAGFRTLGVVHSRFTTREWVKI
jgi:hypothetical protein